MDELGIDGFVLTIFHKLHPANSCPVSGATHGPLCGLCCRFMGCYMYGYRRVFIHDHLGTLSAPSHWQNQHGAPARVLCSDLCIGQHKVYNMMRNSICHIDGCGRGTSLRKFQVARLERVENTTLWWNYERQKTALRERMLHYSHKPERLHSSSITGDRTIYDGTYQRIWTVARDQARGS